MTDCIFCKIAAGELPAAKVYEDEHTVAFFDIFPSAEYHTVVIPKAHYVNVLDIPSDAFSRVMDTVKKVVEIYKDKLGLENLQLIHNAGEHGQQDVFHLHVHIVPRAEGDSAKIQYPKRNPEWRDRFDTLLQKLK